MNLDKRYVRNAYEDVYHYLFEEARLPYNVSELDAKIKNKEDRARLAKVFTKGLDSVVGHTLPFLIPEFHAALTAAMVAEGGTTCVSLPVATLRSQRLFSPLSFITVSTYLASGDMAATTARLELVTWVMVKFWKGAATLR